MPPISWRFDNHYGRLPGVLFSRIAPTPVAAPRLMIFNQALAVALGLDLTGLAEGELAALFAGNVLPDGADPLAQAYAGHQFGSFTRLGDGRAILLGECLTPEGRRVDLQLKGAGRTPYSRSGDGRAALGPMLREYLVSEAMQALGIPTTRALAVVATGEPVFREQAHPGAILTRIAASHLRVGTFEYAVRCGEPVLRALFEATLARHDPVLAEADSPPLAFLQAVLDRQADLVVAWMRVGFIHGVMNTDNMSLAGETLDYGPCAFLDGYDPAAVFSAIDLGGRYAFDQQMACAQWNLARLAETLLPLLPDPDAGREQAEAMILGFGPAIEQRWREMMGRKLGLFHLCPGDEDLIDSLLGWMHQTGADYTNSFRALSDPDCPGIADPLWRQWEQRWRNRLSQQAEPIAAARALMERHNPVYIPRNHRVEAVLAAAEQEGDLAPFRSLLAVLSDPYHPQPGQEAYQQPPTPSERVTRTFCGT